MFFFARDKDYVKRFGRKLFLFNSKFNFILDQASFMSLNSMLRMKIVGSMKLKFACVFRTFTSVEAYSNRPCSLVNSGLYFANTKLRKKKIRPDKLRGAQIWLVVIIEFNRTSI